MGVDLLISIAVATSLLSAAQDVVAGNGGVSDAEWRAGWLQNFSTEMMGAIITFGLFELLAGGHKAKKQVIRNMKNANTSISLTAVEHAREEGWLLDGGLRYADLESANLQAARLNGVDLREANLRYANLQEADLGGADLRGADLRNANLDAAKLTNAKLYKSKLDHANLQRADLSYVRLSLVSLTSANFTSANLRHADTGSVVSHRFAILPNGEQWTKEVDLRKFTDPNHPEFWDPKEHD